MMKFDERIKKIQSENRNFFASSDFFTFSIELGLVSFFGASGRPTDRPTEEENHARNRIQSTVFSSSSTYKLQNAKIAFSKSSSLAKKLLHFVRCHLFFVVISTRVSKEKI